MTARAPLEIFGQAAANASWVGEEEAEQAEQRGRGAPAKHNELDGAVMGSTRDGDDDADDGQGRRRRCSFCFHLHPPWANVLWQCNSAMQPQREARRGGQQLHLLPLLAARYGCWFGRATESSSAC